MAEDELVREHHPLSGPEQIPGDSRGPGVLQSSGLQRVGHNVAAEQQQRDYVHLSKFIELYTRKSEFY